MLVVLIVGKVFIRFQMNKALFDVNHVFQHASNVLIQQPVKNVLQGMAIIQIKINVLVVEYNVLNVIIKLVVNNVKEVICQNK